MTPVTELTPKQIGLVTKRHFAPEVGPFDLRHDSKFKGIVCAGHLHTGEEATTLAKAKGIGEGTQGTGGSG